jgi:predicted transcriptional regulator
MAELRKPDFEDVSSILGEEDEATLAAIDRVIKAADEGRVVPTEEVRLTN